MMLFYGREKRRHNQTKPRKRKNVFALLFLLLYSRLLATKDLGWYRLREPRLRFSKHFDKLALLCVILTVAVDASAHNVTTNNTVSFAKPTTNTVFSTTTAALPVTTQLTDGEKAAELPQVGTNHRPRYATHAAGVYSSQLQHLDDEDDYIDEDENSAFPGHRKQNITERGAYIGSPCEFTCSKRLHHVFCDPATNECTCEKLYPVVIGVTKGCAKPKKLGEQCFYEQTCTYSDANSFCVQVHNNAKCECIQGFHSVVHYKPTKREFCTQDIAVLTSDLPTLLGVTSGIAVLAGLICMVLHLFSKNKFPRHRGHFADTHLPPPILYSSDTGSRRPSLASVHSSSSSIRSYSMMRFEKELQQKEMRHEMKHRLSQMQKHNSAQQLQQTLMRTPKPQINVVELSQNLPRSAAPTPSPLSPNSTEELLPMVDETQEEFTSLFSTRPSASYSGPCTPFDGL